MRYMYGTNGITRNLAARSLRGTFLADRRCSVSDASIASIALVMSGVISGSCAKKSSSPSCKGPRPVASSASDAGEGLGRGEQLDVDV